ncbi:hypothetical protein CU098_011562 [Rhizopus stolonifer]|uniref:PH domain-containing protein n=1 Tax=Rhizopus stolonifer TaxID=4846 RepID=A0A367KSV3_RHIST|nr:hypothetical protein CU098_011562 [Rhizopus stolonifer]
MSTPPPRHSFSLPTSTSGSNERVLPTPSSSTTVRQSMYQKPKQQTERQELEQQLAEKKKQLQGSTSGIGKNVLARQVDQLEEKIKELENQKHDPPSESPFSSERLKHLERDLADYRKPPSLRNKKESFGQQQRVPMTTGLDLLPSPTASSLLPPQHDSTSLLPLPPPPTGSIPTKRRSKVPNTDRRNTDIEFATEIGQGLLLEVRKMQALLQEKEEQLRTLENQKADLERAAEAMAKQMRQREENEEKLKEETWNLELAKQELTISVTELQQNLNKANVEQTKLAKQADELRTEIEHLRASEEKLNNKVENMKNRHEQDMSSMRQHTAVLQKEKTDQAKQIETLTSELAIAKAQSRIVKPIVSEPEPSTRSEQSDDQTQSTTTTKNELSPASSPPPSPKHAPVRNQKMEVETLKSSLAHAHRMISNLRSNLHKEKAEKFELKKLLAESQETIEQMQNDPRLWVDARSEPKEHSKRLQKSPKRRGKKTDSSSRRIKSNSTSVPRIEYVDSTDSCSSMSDINDNDDEGDLPHSPINIDHIGFTSLSSELSQSQFSQRPNTVDAEVNTDPVHIEKAHEPLIENISEASKPDEVKPNSLKQTIGGLMTGAAAAADVLPSTKSSMEVSTQTETTSKGVESSVQTEAVSSTSLPTQIEEPELTATTVAVHTSIQTETRPENVESLMQTATKPTNDISTQTEPRSVDVKGSIQTAADPVNINSVQLETGPDGVENTNITSAKSEGVESSVQTISTPISSLPTQTEDIQGSDVSIQAENDSDDIFTQTNESIDTVKQQDITHRPIQRNDVETQTQYVETKDAQVQYDTDIFEKSSVLPLPLNKSQPKQHPLFNDEDNNSFYYDANSDLNQSKPSSRNTLTNVAGLDDSHQSLKHAGEIDNRNMSALRMSTVEPTAPPKSIPKRALSSEDQTIKLDDDGNEKKMFSKEETDALISTAVNIALAKAKKSQNEMKSNRDSAIVEVPISPEATEAPGIISSTVSEIIVKDKDAAGHIDEEIPPPELIDGPSAAFEQESEEYDDIEDSIPERPTSPPPSSLLSRALSPRRMNKGKMPESDADYQRSLNRTPVSMSSMSTANTHDQLRSVTSSHFDTHSINATDPHMISLITKTMIGDWLWKNTRKAVGGGISENKHQRYFWIHPYSRTLYWSNKSPGLDGNHAKAKSALIENITVVPNKPTKSDDLPDVSMLIQTTHRQLRLTAPNMEQHNNWFEAISHLITRNTGSSIQSPSSRNTNTKSVASSTGNSLLQRASFRRLHDMFHQPSISTTTATQRTESTTPEYEDDPLEDVRMCCNGKHHVSKLERDHKHRRQYRKSSSRIPHNH